MPITGKRTENSESYERPIMTLSIIFLLLMILIFVGTIFLPFYSIYKITLSEIITFLIILIFFIFDITLFKSSIQLFIVNFNSQFLFKFLVENMTISTNDLNLGMLGLGMSFIYLIIFSVIILLIKNTKISTGKFVLNVSVAKQIVFRLIFLFSTSITITFLFSLITTISFMQIGFLENVFKFITNLGVFNYVRV